MSARAALSFSKWVNPTKAIAVGFMVSVCFASYRGFSSFRVASANTSRAHSSLRARKILVTVPHQEQCGCCHDPSVFG